jgi:alkaline phosphatase
MFRVFFTLLFLVLFTSSLIAQYDLNLPDSLKQKEELYYNGSLPEYEVPSQKLPLMPVGKKAKNIILLIGDGTGAAQIYAAYTANRGKLHYNRMPVAGFSITNSSNAYITDSASGATVLAAGVKTYNGAIGVDKDTIRVRTILEQAEEKQLATGLVATCAITHATPASFIAHQPARRMYEEIAADFLDTDIDLFIGGGHDHFNGKKRKDKRDLIGELKAKGYTQTNTFEELQTVDTKSTYKLAAFLAGEHQPRYPQRGEQLAVSTQKALEILSKNDKGFFLMIEGSQIDWGGHADNTTYIVQEAYDFDRAIGQALDFAAKDGETLVIVTADHETGGFSLNGGKIETGEVVGKFTTGGHTGVMVPVFAFGPQAELFGGIQQNYDIYYSMIRALGWEMMMEY